MIIGEVDPRTWRVVGDPLVGPTASGPLDGCAVAVKDLFAVAGQRVGAGVPAWLAEAPVEDRHAAAVSVLLTAGASVRGIAQTDQLAYSVAGTNEHHGAPVNAAVAGAVPGGSSSGCATAVALGEADLGLATDTAGSVRVPASYQGLWGLRTTHGSVDPAGLLPLAPDADTVGLLVRDPALLGVAAGVLVPAATGAVGPGRVVAPDLLDACEPAVATALADVADRLGARPVDLGDVAAAQEAFRVHQARQAWQAHGAWVERHPDALLGAVRTRFEAAARVSVAEDVEACDVLARARQRFDGALGDRVLVLPSASSPAPALDSGPAEVDRVRAATLRLTGVAGVTGRPAVSVPGLRLAHGPVGVGLVGPRGADLALVRLAAEVGARLR